MSPSALQTETICGVLPLSFSRGNESITPCCFISTPHLRRSEGQIGISVLLFLHTWVRGECRHLILWAEQENWTLTYFHVYWCFTCIDTVAPRLWGSFSAESELGFPNSVPASPGSALTTQPLLHQQQARHLIPQSFCLSIWDHRKHRFIPHENSLFPYNRKENPKTIREFCSKPFPAFLAPLWCCRHSKEPWHRPASIPVCSTETSASAQSCSELGG